MSPFRRRLAAACLGLLAIVWLFVNSPVEGAALIVVTPDHGLTVADLPALAVLVIAVLLIVPRG
jgi:hypothetical protein